MQSELLGLLEKCELSVQLAPLGLSELLEPLVLLEQWDAIGTIGHNFYIPQGLFMEKAGPMKEDDIVSGNLKDLKFQGIRVGSD
jgi:hypothetical protein